MIAGLGTDIVEIGRIKEMLEKHRNSFIHHILTEQELAEAESRKDFSAYCAGRWAAKEALSKALGCGIGEHCSWKDIRILNGGKGRPDIQLCGKAFETAEKLGVNSIHLSISHEKQYAVATVILEN
jgi:holo-[acyl-carrier protein] synthase